MNKPVLVIMAAGMGSRYGGLKQIDPVDEEGHIILDFSMYDAKRAGFESLREKMKKVSGQQSVTGCQNTWKFHMHFKSFLTFRRDMKFRKEE